MSIPGSAISLLLSSGTGGYEIERSLRFNSTDSAYLSKAFASAGNRKTWTYSLWVKLGRLNLAYPAILSNSGDVNNYISLSAAANTNRIRWRGGTLTLETTAVLRDPSAWYHLMFVSDTVQATATDRAKIYINGVLQTAFSTSTYWAQNYESTINNSGTHLISQYTLGNGKFDGYLADVHFIDGQALDPTSFGKFDSDTGVWNPVKYNGTYGQNGFYLPFSDNSTTSALGTDTSGNGNDWTVNNLTAGNNWNQSQIWSDNKVGTFASNLEVLAFNGILSTSSTDGRARPDNGTTAGFDFSGLGTVSSLRVWVHRGGSGGSVFTINGVDVTSTVDAATNSAFVDFGSTFSSFTEIRFNAIDGTNWYSIAGIEVNSRLLVNPQFVNYTDSFVDSPTNYGKDTGVGGEVRGNYSTLNPINPLTCTLANGNLECTTPVSGSTFGTSTFNIPKSGKWYWEFTTTTNGSYSFSGVRNIIDITQYVVYWALTGEKYVNGSASAYGASCTTGDIIGVAVDSDAGTVTFYKNNVSQGAISVSFASGNYAATFQDGTSSLGVNFTVNFGQRPFVYQAPTDHKCLCSTNLPTPTIKNGSDYMTAVTYSGNGSTQTIETGFSPDLVWVKGRNETFYHRLTTSLQTQPNYLASNATDAEASGNGVISALTSTGFTVDINGGTGGTNTTGINYVGWAWDAGSSTVTNNDGSITSQVRANPSAGFSIVTYTGTGANATVGHGLGVAPGMVIVKGRGSTGTTDAWAVWHQYASTSAGRYLLLEKTYDVATDPTVFNSTNPGSSVFSIGTWNGINKSGIGFVAYCFAPVEGYSAFGSYTGNGSADGPFIYTGFRPRWILVKNITTGGFPWVLHDTARNSYNPSNLELQANSSSAEYDTAGSGAGNRYDILSNGFKNRTTGLFTNGSSNTYIYAAFAENPFSISRAR